MAETLGGDPAAWSYANVMNTWRRLDNGYIRVEADEISYPLHVILRYRLEQAMLKGDLAVADIPGAWNELFEKLLGRPVPSDTLGCLQDIHWAAGLVGYFPNFRRWARSRRRSCSNGRRKRRRGFCRVWLKGISSPISAG